MKADLHVLPPLVVITGPTATGKSEVGVMVAERAGGEVVSADSMLIYRGMDIGTAKPTRAEMRGIPHHMIDIVEPEQDYSVALFQEQARAVINEIHERRKLPVLVGGTGLYIRAVVDDYDFGGAGGDKSLREKFLKEAMEYGPEYLHRRLAEVDPAAASRLHPQNLRRVIRALEVYHLTGRPISSYHRIHQSGPLYNLFMFGLIMKRDRLYRRIEQRVDRMIEAGLVDEVRRLLRRGLTLEHNSMRGLGYKEIAAYLQGMLSLEEAVDVLKRNTRRFAKRQLTWFRRDTRIKWYDLDDYGGPEAVVEEIAGRLEGVS
ncbi:MAG: tRNA (adenosine(37)-N6)-dimethylallyltransferase MiaA [Peptococcaceae bacterium]|nr:tRNA (adenosine(37)-N6)-dimethylallyltransferase MiaA [Peptococcaceae bacterium]